MDSHLQTPRITNDPQQEAVFRAGLAAGADGVMVGHLIPEDGGPDPATLDGDWLHRSQARLGGGRSFLVLADDVSMGGLREPMGRRGITVEGDSGEGMLPVEALPAGWFAALDAGGADLLLVRGIPLKAFPCPPGGEVPAEERPAPVLDPGFDDGPYREARLALVGAGLPAAGGGACFLDLVAADRWQVAIGTGKQEHGRLLRELGRHFRALVRCTTLDQVPAAVGKIDRLLVASHRPLPRNWRDGPWSLAVADRLAAGGDCRVLGHPSLEEEMRSFLPGSWCVTPCFDVTWDDLSGG